jgi:hypothetical protein
MSDLKTLQGELAEANANLAGKEKALNGLIKMAEKTKTDPDTVDAIKQFTEIRDGVKAQVEKLTAAVASAERVERTKTIVEPLIAAFGTVTVPAATEFRVEFVDIAATLNTLASESAKIESRVSALNALNAVLTSLSVSDEVAADLKAVRFIPDGVGKSYTLALAKAGGSRTGGTRASTKNEIYTITKANEQYASLVGQKIGKGQDFESWREFIKAADPSLFAELEAKKNGTFVGPDGKATGKKSNYSGSVIATRKFGAQWDTEVLAEAAPAAEAEAA